MGQVKKGPPVSVDDKFFRTQEVADRLGITRASVWNLINSNRLRAVRIGTRRVRIPESAFEEYLRTNQIGL